ISSTFIMTCSVPDRGGLPPSIAVSTSLITDSLSRSSDFCSTSSAEALCCPALCTSNEKYSFGLIL
uniref:Uncharacterized protein n=1 Tax=Electrophorus electricus TaxID=8005 RepID=A0A4W4E9Q5_ELEEL